MNQFLSFAFEVKAADEETGIIEGYASTFGNVDLGLDVVEKGAFAKTIKESKGKIPILADHDPRKQIGWNLEAMEDDRGLYVKGQLDIKNNQAARERFSLVKQARTIGAKAGLSIGYATIKSNPDPNNLTIRRLTELKLWEYSLVTFPMNTEAMVTAAKQWAESDSPEKAIEQCIAALKEKGYADSQILLALESRAAARKNEPGHDAHSVLQQMERLEKLMTA